MERLLVHVCCAHCAAYTLRYWQEANFEVIGFWYNPNIHPYLEHEERLKAMKVLAERTGTQLVVAPSYEITAYFEAIIGKQNRCQACYELRLTKTAKKAQEDGFAGFTTTLLISPTQQHEIVREVGERLAQLHHTRFFYADLRKRYSDSRHLTKPLMLYRQQYCGCLFSEFERYSQVKK